MTRAPRAAEWRYAALGLGIVLVLGLFGRLAGTDPDEEYALASTAHGLAYAFHRAIFYELQAPLWFLIVAVWRVLDPSAGFARLFSVGCAVATCFALRSIALRVRPALDPFPFVALVALNPFFVYAALEVRVYAFAMLLSALSWIAFYDGYLAGEDRAARLRFALLGLVSIYSFYYLGFLLVGCLAALLVARRFASLRAFLPVVLGLAVASVPALLAIRATFADVRAALPPLSGPFGREFLQPVAQFVLPTVYRWADVPSLVPLTYAYRTLLLVLFLLLLAARPRLGVREWGIIALSLGIWIAYPAAYAVTHVRFEIPRHYVTLFVPFAAGVYAALSAFGVRWRRLALAAILVAYAGCSAVSLWANYGAFSKAGDMRRVGAYVTAHASADDVVAVFAADAKPAFMRFYRGRAPVVAFPVTPDPEHYDTSLYEVHSVAQAAAALERLAAGRRLWFVRYGRCFPRMNYGCEYIAAALHERFPAARAVEFYEAEVVEVDALPPRKNAGMSPARGTSSAGSEMRASLQKKTALRPSARA
jgi:hypothetical protein